MHSFFCFTDQMIASSENELAELSLINKALEKAEKAWKKVCKRFVLDAKFKQYFA